MPDSDKEIARRFIEDALIVSGRRVGVAEVAVFDQYKISKELLDKLLDSRIIRAEVTHLGKGYELSHDTLVAPLSKLSEKHREKERERVLNRTRWALAGSSILVLFSLTALIVAIIFYKQAKTANNDANNRLKEALQEQIQRQELELKDLERKINTYKQSELNNAPIIQEIISLRDSIDLRKKDNELKIKYIDN